MIRKSGYLVLVAVTLVLVGTLLTADSFAEFEQRAMTRLFVLAALDTLVGSRLVSAARAIPPATQSPKPGLPDNRTADPYLRGVCRHPEMRLRGTARHWTPAVTTDRSGP